MSTHLVPRISPPSKQRQFGFTLIEVLVVVAIIGTVIGVVTLVIGTVDQRRYRSDLDHLRQQLQYCADYSLYQQVTLGWRLSDDKTDILQLDTSGDWQPFQNPNPTSNRANQLLSHPTFSADTKLQFIEPEPALPNFDADEHSKPPPQIVFLASGQHTPLTLEIKHSRYPTWVLHSDGFNPITLEVADDS